jgi:PqqD family protein of HPr-rel-A system
MTENGHGGPGSDHPPRPSSDVTLERTGREAILYDRANRQVHAVNESAALLFELCDGESSEETVTQKFAAAYGLPVETVEEDVREILGTFRRLGVVV